MAPTKKKSHVMTDSHKAALAEGREQGRAVRNYLEALNANKPKRGRRRTEESIKSQLEQVERDLVDADPLKQLQLTQRQIDLQNALSTTDTTVDLSGLEAGFIAAAKPYAERKGISYAAFRAVGVTPAVLKQAGISRAS